MKGWRTVLFGVGLAAAGVLQQADWATLVPPQYAGYALALIGGVVVVLRAITTTPVGGS